MRLDELNIIEGLHDAVCTYAGMMRQHLLVSFCTVRYGEKQQKNYLTFDLLHGKSCNFHRVCMVIFLPLACNLVRWYELNKKLWNILLLFPIPSHANGKPIWRSQVWWLAEFPWYDVTWKPPIIVKWGTIKIVRQLIQQDTKKYVKIWFSMGTILSWEPSLVDNFQIWYFWLELN